MGQVPAATRALRVLRFLAGQPDPVTARPARRARSACRARTAYHLLDRDDRGGLRRPPARGAPLRPRRRGVRGGQRLRPPGAAAADRPAAARRARRHGRAERAPRGAARPRRALRPRGAGPGPAAAGHRRRRPAARPPDRERPGDPGGAARSAGPRALPGPDGVRRPARRGPAVAQRRCGRCCRDPAARLRRRGGRGHPGLRVASRRRCSTTTGTRSPGSRSPTPSTPTSRSTATVAATLRCADALTRRLGGSSRAQ